MTKKSVDVHPGAITSQNEGKPSTSQLKDDDVRRRGDGTPGESGGEGRSKDSGEG